MPEITRCGWAQKPGSMVIDSQNTSKSGNAGLKFYRARGVFQPLSSKEKRGAAQKLIPVACNGACAGRGRPAGRPGARPDGRRRLSRNGF